MERVLKTHYDGRMHANDVLPFLFYGEESEIVKMRSYVHVFGTKQMSAYLEKLISRHGEMNQQTVAKKIFEPYVVYSLEFFYNKELLPKALMSEIGQDKKFYHLDEDFAERDVVILPRALPEERRKLIISHLQTSVYSSLNPRWAGTLQDALNIANRRHDVVEPLMKSVGVFKHKGSLKVWLTNDRLKLPVLMKSKVLVGSI